MSNNIRNFCILAHIDHGKSTLADRFLELTGTVSGTVIKPQFLDTNPISRERGITIKLAPVRMIYKNYIFNLIDTPGHVDFSYEVSRALAACEGAILLVDATAGIQAQTISYFNKAKQQGLAVIPVVNKIDLALAMPEETALSMVKTFGFGEDEILFISAKTGEGVAEVLKEIMRRVPPPTGKENKPLRALVFDSFYDNHKGVIAQVRVVDGRINPGSRLIFMANRLLFSPLEVGFFQPHKVRANNLLTGEVGFVATGLKDISLVRVGDTLTDSSSVLPLPGYQQPQPMVFSGIYPVDQNNFTDLAQALEKLKLNDASLTFAGESSLALGKGFRVGFMGPLHGEVVIERLEREFDLELVSTAPNVEYIIKIKDKILNIKNIAEIPIAFDEILEPIVNGIIITPQEYLGKILEVCQRKRGKQKSLEYLEKGVKLEYELPLAEIIVDFFDQLKSLSSGFASFDYEFIEFQVFDGVKVNIFVGGKVIDALSVIIPKDQAYRQGREIIEKLNRVIPKQMFEFSIQASIGNKIIARVTKKAWRKDVTAKLYGGDQTRKDKLLKKQKKGKKRMKAVGQVYIPQEAFLSVLKR